VLAHVQGGRDMLLRVLGWWLHRSVRRRLGLHARLQRRWVHADLRARREVRRELLGRILQLATRDW
jgi:hypothetical protein